MEAAAKCVAEDGELEACKSSELQESIEKRPFQEQGKAIYLPRFPQLKLRPFLQEDWRRLQLEIPLQHACSREIDKSTEIRKGSPNCPVFHPILSIMHPEPVDARPSTSVNPQRTPDIYTDMILNKKPQGTAKSHSQKAQKSY